MNEWCEWGECPHCGMELYPHTARRHVRLCPRNPAQRAGIVAALSDPQRPGYAVSYYAYDRRAQRLHAPSTALLFRAWGSWMAVCAAFGLRYDGRRSRAEKVR